MGASRDTDDRGDKFLLGIGRKSWKKETTLKA